MDPALRQARDLTAQFMAAMFNFQTPYCLSLLGPSGTGKSLLARLVAAFFQRYMTHKQDRALSDGIWRCGGGFVEWGAALDTMLKTGDWNRMSNYRHDFFVVLDDITSEHEKLKELSASKLFDILNARQGKRWTIVTANCSLNQIGARLDPRIASRLIRDHNVCLELPATTPDYAIRH